MSKQSTAHSRAVRDILRVLGALPAVRLWPVVQGVAVPLGARTPRRFGTLSGAADLSGVLGIASADGAFSAGRRLEIEVKTGTGRPSARQRDYLAVLARFGALAFVAGGAAGALAELERAGYSRNLLECQP